MNQLTDEGARRAGVCVRSIQGRRFNQKHDLAGSGESDTYGAWMGDCCAHRLRREQCRLLDEEAGPACQRFRIETSTPSVVRLVCREMSARSVATPVFARLAGQAGRMIHGGNVARASAARDGYPRGADACAPCFPVGVRQNWARKNGCVPAMYGGLLHAQDQKNRGKMSHRQPLWLRTRTPP